MNVHNSPRDRKGREWERDRAEAIEIAAIKELRQGRHAGVRSSGDFNEHAEAYCEITGSTDLVAASGGTNGGGTCRPPATRCAWTGSSAPGARSSPAS